jgi:hypothetical protein
MVALRQGALMGLMVLGELEGFEALEVEFQGFEREQEVL